MSSCVHWQWEKRDKNTAAAPRVSHSLSHSVNQPPITSLPEHCNHLHKQHPQSSIIRANHASRWLVYVPLPCSRRACTKSCSASSYSHILLHHTARTDQQQEQHKPNESPQRQNPTQPTSTRASSSKWQCQRKGGAPNHSHINLPHTDARKVSNRIDDATSAKPRSEEGGGEVCNEVNAD